jgi:hypothetical protein
MEISQQSRTDDAVKRARTRTDLASHVLHENTAKAGRDSNFGNLRLQPKQGQDS